MSSEKLVLVHTSWTPIPDKKDEECFRFARDLVDSLAPVGEEVVAVRYDRLSKSRIVLLAGIDQPNWPSATQVAVDQAQEYGGWTFDVTSIVHGNALKSEVQSPATLGEIYLSNPSNETDLESNRHIFGIEASNRQIPVARVSFEKTVTDFEKQLLENQPKILDQFPRLGVDQKHGVVEEDDTRVQMSDATVTQGKVQKYEANVALLVDRLGQVKLDRDDTEQEQQTHADEGAKAQDPPQDEERATVRGQHAGQEIDWDTMD